MTQVKSGDTIKVHYTGKLQDGTIFDSSSDREPLEFTIGNKQIIPGFEDAVVGMAVGDSKTVTLTQEEAYGSYREDMIAVVERNQFPENINPEIGQQFQVPQENGETVVVTVTEMTDENVTLDGNHPLAGKDLTFDIELVEIC